jgi:hypothetical protein
MPAAWARGAHPEAGERARRCSRTVPPRDTTNGHHAEEVIYLGLALNRAYVEGFVEGCLERIGEDDPDEEGFSEGRPGGERRPGVRPGGAQGRGGREGGQALNVVDRAVFAAYGWPDEIGDEEGMLKSHLARNLERSAQARSRLVRPRIGAQLP